MSSRRGHDRGRWSLASGGRCKGKAKKVDMTDEHLAVAEPVRPKLIQDGMFLVGRLQNRELAVF